MLINEIAQKLTNDTITESGHYSHKEGVSDLDVAILEDWRQIVLDGSEIFF